MRSGWLTKSCKIFMKFHISRLGQKGFTFAMFISFSIIILLSIIMGATNLVVLFVFINFAWMVLLYIGRLHDIGYSGWWTILVMFTSLLGVLVLASYAGKKEKNEYGEVPPKSISDLLYFWRERKVIN